MNSNNDRVILFGCDHNGVTLKNEIISLLQDLNYQCIDFGGHDPAVKIDYVDIAKQVAINVSTKKATRAMLFCGTAQGMAIVANKFDNVRAALCDDVFTATKSREHNDSNILCIGSWKNSVEEAKEIVLSWLNEPFGEGRHVLRVSRIDKKSGIIMVNGCFDVLTKAHVSLLKFAKTQGDKLIVAIDSDERVRQLKGESRPINSEADRKALLESLDCVDEVLVFNNKEELQKLYKTVSPACIVRGGEHTADEVRQRDGIPEHIQVKIFPYIEGVSTTNTLKKIRSLTTCEKT